MTSCGRPTFPNLNIVVCVHQSPMLSLTKAKDESQWSAHRSNTIHMLLTWPNCNITASFSSEKSTRCILNAVLFTIATHWMCTLSKCSNKQSTTMFSLYISFLLNLSHSFVRGNLISNWSKRRRWNESQKKWYNLCCTEYYAIFSASNSIKYMFHSKSVIYISLIAVSHKSIKRKQRPNRESYHL